MKKAVGEFLREMMFMREPWEVVSIGRELRAEGRMLDHLMVHVEIPKGSGCLVRSVVGTTTGDRLARENFPASSACEPGTVSRDRQMEAGISEAA